MTRDELEECELQLLKVEHYNKYPRMMPWIGSNYGERYKRVLFVGESHYLPEGSTAQLITEHWYSSYQDNLTDYEIEHITTRDALQKNHLRNEIWKNTGEIMLNKGILPPLESKNVFDWFCFYNFFQRPAEEGKGLIINNQDIRQANKVFLSNVKILKPEIVIFLSSKSWYSSNKNGMNDIIFDFVPHPSSNWWNRKSLKYAVVDRVPLTGREKFERLVDCFYENGNHQ